MNTYLHLTSFLKGYYKADKQSFPKEYIKYWEMNKISSKQYSI